MSASHAPPPAGMARTMLVSSFCSHAQLFLLGVTGTFFLVPVVSQPSSVLRVFTVFSVSRERSQLRILEREPKSRCDVFFCCFVCTVDKGNVIQCQAFIGLAAEPCLPRQVRTKATIAKTLPHACQEISCAEFSGFEISLRRCSRGEKKSFWDSVRAKCTKERCG